MSVYAQRHRVKIPVHEAHCVKTVGVKTRKITSNKEHIEKENPGKGSLNRTGSKYQKSDQVQRIMD